MSKARRQHHGRADRQSGIERRVHPSQTGTRTRSAKRWIGVVILAIAVAAFALLARSKRPNPSVGNALPDWQAKTELPGGDALPSPFGPPSPKGGAVKPDGLFAQGTRLLREQKFAEAIDCFRGAIELDPKSEDAHYNLGLALAGAGHKEEAKESYEAALRIMPTYAEAHNNLALLLTKERRWEEAIVHYEKSLEILPDNPKAHNNLGIARACLNRIDEAVASFDRAVQLDTNYFEAQFNLANAHLRQGKIHQAIEHYQETLRIRPDFEPARERLARLTQDVAN